MYSLINYVHPCVVCLVCLDIVHVIIYLFIVYLIHYQWASGTHVALCLRELCFVSVLRDASERYANEITLLIRHGIKMPH